MADPRFFTVHGPFTLNELAAAAGAEIGEGADGDRLFTDVAALDSAGGSDVSFLDNRKYIDAFTRSGAGACIVAPDLAGRAPRGMALLLSAKPYRGYARIARLFYPVARPEAGISGAAHVDPEATIGEGCRIEAGAVISRRAKIGSRTVIRANAVIGEGVVVGDDTEIGACASLSHCVVGSRVVIYPGVRIGQQGFGFAMDSEGHVAVPQLGRVIIHDDVEIGANSTIDRGAGPDTVVGPGTMIDNLVQLGHNIQTGRGCAIAAQVGISGSTRLGDFVALGGQVGLSGHLSIGDGVMVAAQGGVIRDVAPGEKVGGTPAVPISQWHRQTVALQRLIKSRGDK